MLGRWEKSGESTRTAIYYRDKNSSGLGGGYSVESEVLQHHYKNKQQDFSISSIMLEEEAEYQSAPWINIVLSIHPDKMITVKDQLRDASLCSASKTEHDSITISHLYLDNRWETSRYKNTLKTLLNIQKIEPLGTMWLDLLKLFDKDKNEYAGYGEAIELMQKADGQIVTKAKASKDEYVPCMVAFFLDDFVRGANETPERKVYRERCRALMELYQHIAKHHPDSEFQKYALDRTHKISELMTHQHLQSTRNKVHAFFDDGKRYKKTDGEFKQYASLSKLST